jgi:putative transposase
MKSLKIRLELNNQQVTLAKKHAGVARYAYNWGLNICNEAYKNGKKRPSAIDLHKKFVKEEKSQKEWLYEVSKCSPQEALRNLDTAFKRFFQKTSKPPQFKKKGIKDSFYLEGNIKTNGSQIKLPIFGWVRMSESPLTPKGGIIKNVTVSQKAGHWFVAFKVPFKPVKVKHPQGAVGVDLGISTLATLSDGQMFPNLRPYKTYKRRLKIAQRQMSKKWKKGQKEQSKNYQKAKQKVAKLHYKIGCIRQDSIHKLTTYLAQNHSEIVIEDLNVSGMSKNHKLASAILDGGFYAFRRQLTYKCEWYGSKVTVVNRFYPSSKTCSQCGTIKQDLTLKDRMFQCAVCDFHTGRDLNAAINLKKQAVSYTVSACRVPKPSKPKR